MTPPPVVQVKVAFEPESTLPGAGVLIAAGTGEPDAV
jgi:hypothetical protein